MSVKTKVINTLNNILQIKPQSQALWDNYSNEASHIAEWFDFSTDDIIKSKQINEFNKGPIEIKRLTWFIPEFDNPFWGGIHTILRFAAFLKREKGVENCFVIRGDVSKEKIHMLIEKAFPELNNAEICIIHSENELDQLKESDAAICTLWTTAYNSLKFNNSKRKFYFIQDFEPLFYPAGSTSAQAEETYRFGFYGLCNTISLKNIYESNYNGMAEYFTPCVDVNIFHPGVNQKPDKFTVFFYGRPGHPRNGFELGIATLKKLKNRMGDKVRIVTAGANWKPQDYGLESIVENLGLLSYNETAELYRKCDAALIMMFTKHPSYIPFELMASGCLVITNYNPANIWLLRDRENCLLSYASPTALSETIEIGLVNENLRKTITQNALVQINNDFSNWDKEIEKIYTYMCNPKT